MGGAPAIVGEVRVTGAVHGRSDVTVNGRLEGTVELQATLTVGPAAVLRADLHVLRAVIEGVVVGNIHARDWVELLPGARVVGNIATPELVMHDGARFRGDVVERAEVAPVVPSSRPPLASSEPPPSLAPLSSVPPPRPAPIRRADAPSAPGAPPPTSPPVGSRPTTAPPMAPSPAEGPAPAAPEPSGREKRTRRPGGSTRPAATPVSSQAPLPPPPMTPPAPRSLPGRGASIEIKRR